MDDNDDTQAAVYEGNDMVTTEVGSCGAKVRKVRATAEVMVREDVGAMVKGLR